MTALWQSRFIVPKAAVELFLEQLAPQALSVAAFEAAIEPADANADQPSWQIELLHDAPPDPSDLQAAVAPLARALGLQGPAISIAPVPETDWLAAARAAAKPQAIGRFWLHPSHVDQAPPAGSLAIQIDAGLAFGSGEHESTKGCLLALDHLAGRTRCRRVLDLGCGSGILAIAAAKCWPARVVAADVDPEAVRVAAANAAHNGVGQRVITRVSDGYADRLLGQLGPYDLILANILADPLCAMAGALARHLAPGGFAILAGLLDRQAPRVIAAHQRHGLQLRQEFTLGPWTSLLMSRKKGERRSRHGPPVVRQRGLT